MHKPHTKEELANLVNDRSVNLGCIDTSLISDMSMLFRFSDRTDFAGIENWDVSSVTDMSCMFFEAEKFNQSLKDWDVSNVTDMAYMFCDAREFNQYLNDWDVSNVTDMAYMFCDAREFNQRLADWNVSKVTDMSYMFCGAKRFDQSLNLWNVSSVKKADCMFKKAKGYDKSMCNWKFSDSMDHEPVDFIEGCFLWGFGNNCNDLPLMPSKQRKVSLPKQKAIFNLL